MYVCTSVDMIVGFCNVTSVVFCNFSNITKDYSHFNSCAIRFDITSYILDRYFNIK